MMQIIVDEMPEKAKECPYHSTFGMTDREIRGTEWYCTWNQCHRDCFDPEYNCPFFTAKKEDDDENNS